MQYADSERCAAFRALHESGCFVLPNPWDAGSARLLEQLGFKALASTSAGMAWSLGRADGAVGLDEVLPHLALLVRATTLPVNADFEQGFADAPEAVAHNVLKALDTGIAGLSIEDYTGEAARGLYDFTLAVDRVAAAKAAIESRGGGAVLTARSEGFIRGKPDLDETIRRLQAFAVAGADCLYAPGLRAEAQIRAVVEAVAPKPVNVLASDTLSVPMLAAWGVRRVSTGGSLARTAWGEFRRAAEAIAKDGSFAAFGQGASGAELNKIFAPQAPS
jgi:2-methylisocitrate lyase-like PEP mutase family enzyme